MLTLIINPGGVTITRGRKERERDMNRCQSKRAGGSARGSERKKKKAKVRGNSSKWEPLILLIRLAATRRVITNVKRYEKS